MIDTLNNVINNKSIDTYKIIEDRYIILKRYLRNLIKENRLEIQNVECILDSLDNPVCSFTIKEIEENEND